MSNQMGFIAYHVAVAHPGQVEFVDLRGLVEPTFTSCPLTASRARTPLGLDFNYEPYFALRTELERRCGVPRPEILYDYYLPQYQTAQVLGANGYVLKFAEVGSRPDPSRLFPGDRGERQDRGQFVAVRADLLASADTAVVWLRSDQPDARHAR